MVLTALRGALGFCSRLPVGRDDAAWAAFRRTPAAFPLAGYVLGPVLALPVLAGLPGPTTALAFVAWVVAVTGVNHVDGLADLGDAAAVHGDPPERREVMRDTTVGVGAVVAAGVDLVGLALAGLALARLPLWPAVALVVAAEVTAKTAVAALVCLGDASHDGFGAAFADRAGPLALAAPLLVAAPLLLLGGWGPAVAGAFDPVPSTTASLAFAPLAAVAGWAPIGAAAAFGGAVVGAALLRWTRRHLGGVGGDVFGAANELARLGALHAGVVAWTLW